MKWKPFSSGTPYTCKDCPAYVELKAETERLQKLSDHWKTMYEIVSARLYKIENGWSVRVCDDPEAVRGE